MARAIWTVIGVACTLGVIAVSMRMNYAFGYALGSTPLNAELLGALSVGCDGLKCLLPLFIAWQAQDRRYLAALAGVLLFLPLLAYGTASAIGFVAENRGMLSTGRQNLNAELKDSERDLASDETRLKTLPAHRLTGVISADIAAQQKDRIWDATRSCQDATATASREFCKHVELLRAELSVATEAHALSKRIEALKATIRSARRSGAGRDADPQIGPIVNLSRRSHDDVRTALVWLFALTVEAISSLGLFAIIRRARPANTPDATSGAAVDRRRPWQLVPEENLPPRTRTARPKRSAARDEPQSTQHWQSPLSAAVTPPSREPEHP